MSSVVGKYASEPRLVGIRSSTGSQEIFEIANYFSDVSMHNLGATWIFCH